MEVILTACRERTTTDSPTCCEEQVQLAVVFTSSYSGPTMESTDSVLTLELQVEGSDIEDNSMCSSVKAGEHVESWSNSSVPEELDCEAIGQVSKSELQPVGLITGFERCDIVIRFVEAEWIRRLPHLWAVIRVVLVMAIFW